MKQVQVGNKAILRRETLRLDDWSEGTPFVVPIKRRFGAARLGVPDPDPLVELVVGILRNRQPGGFARVWRARRNARLDREGRRWTFAGRSPGHAAPLPEEAFELLVSTKTKT